MMSFAMEDDQPIELPKKGYLNNMGKYEFCYSEMQI